MTGKLSTIARPYATAAFEHALKEKALPQWETFLNTAALIAKSPSLASLLENPKITMQQCCELFCEILASMLDAEKKNFIYLLAENKRLPVLPDIAELFSNLRAAYEKEITVQIISAAPLDERYQQKFAAALTDKLQQRVTLQCEIDPALLGGAMIRAGDTVLDGSVRGKLNRLVEFL
jgi:F-type H+-transporting ATPase subunit delta